MNLFQELFLFQIGSIRSSSHEGLRRSRATSFLFQIGSIRSFAFFFGGWVAMSFLFQIGSIRSVSAGWIGADGSVSIPDWFD